MQRCLVDQRPQKTHADPDAIAAHLQYFHNKIAKYFLNS